jgi:phospholipid/cholesterol/gamma-HCH transport system substrate-binding protein
MDADLMQQVNEQIAPLKAKAERLIENLDSIVTVASKIINSEAQHNISESLKQINLTMINLENISGNLNDVITGQKKNLASTISNLSDVTSNLKNNSGKLGHIMNNFSAFSDSITKLQLNKTVGHLDGSVAYLQTILSKIDTANGTLGLLVNDPKLYQNLSSTSANLNRLLVDFRQNPKRYVHFSAIDFSKNSKSSTEINSQITGNILFRVLLFSSPSPVSLTSQLFKVFDEVSEINSGNRYEYYTAPKSSYDEVRIVLNKAQSAFPEAFLKAYKNGKEISLKNAIKSFEK